MMTSIVGQSVPKTDGLGQVTGSALYIDDIKYPGMHYIKMLHSPVHRGLIRNLDVSAAENVPGVLGTITAKDVPGQDGYGFFMDQQVFASEFVCYRGERIAGVVAVDEDAALEGVSKIKVDIEEQEPVFDMFEAMKPESPLVRPNLETNLWDKFGDGTQTIYRLRAGDVEAGFAEADEIVETEIYEATHDHAQLEPHISIAFLDDAGRLAIHTDSQAFYLHLVLCLCPVLGLPTSKIRYIGGRIGGGFGGRNDVHTDHITGIAALKFKVPVKWRLTRREDLATTMKRGPYIFKVKDGVKKDGRIVARYVKCWHDCGAWAGMGPYAVGKIAQFGMGPYSVPNLWYDGWSIFTNKPPATSMRGFATTNGCSAIELAMDRAAEAIGMSPWEIRLINAWRMGERGGTQYEVPSPGTVETLLKAAELAGVDLPDHLKAMTSERR
jgi:CO/xanthine dehydrogenase Mo-binding subunit